MNHHTKNVKSTPKNTATESSNSPQLILPKSINKPSTNPSSIYNDLYRGLKHNKSNNNTTKPKLKLRFSRSRINQSKHSNAFSR